MRSREKIVKTGNFLFRWRSYAPLPVFMILSMCLADQLYPNHWFDTIWDPFCISISFLGLGIRILVIGYVPKGTSGRNRKIQTAETLNTTGMYSIVRHPLYLGNFFISLGILLSAKLWWFTLSGLIIFGLYYGMIVIAEEEFLCNKFGDLYLEWAEKTPAFLPKFINWQSPILPFSVKNILRREYPGFFGIIASFVFLETIENRIATGRFWLGSAWIVMLVLGVATYITLRTLKKGTKVLDVEGR